MLAETPKLIISSDVPEGTPKLIMTFFLSFPFFFFVFLFLVSSTVTEVGDQTIFGKVARVLSIELSSSDWPNQIITRNVWKAVHLKL